MPELLRQIGSWAETATAAGLYAAMQGAVGLLGVFVICALAPRLNPSLRCWLWRLAFARLVIALFWSAPVALPLAPPTKAIAPAVSEGAVRVVSVDSSAGGVGLAPPTAAPMAPLGLALLWISGMGWVLYTGVRHLKAAKAVVRSARPVTHPLVLRVWSELVRDFGLTTAPELCEAAHLKGPVLLQIARPTVVLPAGITEEWSPDQIRMMLAHELAHLRRHDLLWGWLPAAAHLIFYFHPLVWLGNREWRLAHDMAADALALRVTRIPAADYAHLLVRAAGTPAVAHTGLALMDARDTARTLERRLTGMKRLVTYPRRGALLASMAVLAAAAAILVPIRVVAQAPTDPSDPVERRSVNEPAPTPTRDSDAARSEKEREAERSDPAAGARVATPRARNTRETASDDLAIRRNSLDTRGVLPTDEERKVHRSDRAPIQRDVRVERTVKTDGKHLQDLEKRLRALEHELQRAAELNRKLDEERRRLELELRALRAGEDRRSEVVRPDDRRRGDTPQFRTEERRVIIREPRAERVPDSRPGRRDTREEEREHRLTPVEPRGFAPGREPRSYRALPVGPNAPPANRDSRLEGRGYRALPVDPSAPPANRDDPNYRALPTPPRTSERARPEPNAPSRRGGSERPADERPRSEPNAPSRRGGSERPAPERPRPESGATPRRGDNGPRTPEGLALRSGGPSRELALRIVQGSPNGERLLATSQTNVLTGEWAVFETPSGRRIGQAAEAAGGQSIGVRVIEGKRAGELFIQVRQSDQSYSELLPLRPGQAIRLEMESAGRSKPLQLEIQVMTPERAAR